MAKGRALSTGNLPRGGLPRNSVDRITDRPEMTSAVDRGRKALTQLNLSVEQQDMSAWLRKKLHFFSFSPLPTHRVIFLTKSARIMNHISSYHLSSCSVYRSNLAKILT